jgi:hypothetical protein
MTGACSLIVGTENLFNQTRENTIQQFFSRNRIRKKKIFFISVNKETFDTKNYDILFKANGSQPWVRTPV